MIKISKNILVSVIIPIRNEEKYIDKCIDSIINQDFILDNIEVIFIDGLSEDRTTEIVNSYIQIYPQLIKLLNNPHKTVPYAMNIGIKNSTGKYIIRLDAHSEYSTDYISKCISTIIETDADNVGGLAITKGYGVIGEAFSKVLSSKFGVGNSGFRTNASSGYIDTVPFGTFKRETFLKYGLYDERLTRNQDYELNYRIRKNRGKVYLNSKIKLTYFCKNSIKGIIKQSYENGKWNVITSKLCPGTMSIRHFIPMLFTITLILLPLLALFIPTFWILITIEMCLYLILNIYFSYKISSKFYQFLVLIVLFPMFHISYGSGSIAGVIKWVTNT